MPHSIPSLEPARLPVSTPPRSRIAPATAASVHRLHLPRYPDAIYFSATRCKLTSPFIQSPQWLVPRWPSLRQESSLLMESSNTVPLEPEEVQRGSPQASSDGRMGNGQRLVHRMPNNPKIIAFESTQHRFEVPLRPEQWSLYATTGGHLSSPQQQPAYPVSRKRNAFDDSTSDFMDVPDRGTSRRKSNLSDSLNKDYECCWHPPAEEPDTL